MRTPHTSLGEGLINHSHQGYNGSIKCDSLLDDDYLFLHDTWIRLCLCNANTAVTATPTTAKHLQQQQQLRHKSDK